MHKRLCVLIAATLLSPAAFAADWTGWYAGASVGHADGDSNAKVALGDSPAGPSPTVGDVGVSTPPGVGGCGGLEAISHTARISTAARAKSHGQALALFREVRSSRDGSWSRKPGLVGTSPVHKA